MDCYKTQIISNKSIDKYHKYFHNYRIRMCREYKKYLEYKDKNIDYFAKKNKSQLTPEQIQMKKEIDSKYNKNLIPEQIEKINYIIENIEKI